MDLWFSSIAELGTQLRNGSISAVELTTATLDRIRSVDDKLKSFVTVCEETAVKDAEEADRRLRDKQSITPLTGIPFAAKDCFCTRGVRTTCSSEILKDFVPPYDASVITKLKEAGAILIGKNNMDEFGMGSSCENSKFFTTRNPWNPNKVAGGSSGGSAVSVAAGMSPFSIGEDTGGSIRMPAAFCGITGLKPTYGRVSRYGQIALASSFDSIGPMTRSVEDAAIVLSAIAGHDPRDSTSLTEPVPDYAGELGTSLDGLTVGVPREFFEEGIEPSVVSTVRDAIEHIKSLGAAVADVSIEHTRFAIPVYYTILFAESSANLARFDGMRFGLSLPERAKSILETYCKTRSLGFGTEVKRRIMLGTFVLSSGYYDAYYGLAQKVRTLMKADFANAFSKVDALLTPVCPSTAFNIGDKTDDPLAMYLSDIHVTSNNIVGIPALTVPCGLAAGLPIGLQIHGPRLSEPTLFRLGHAYQSTTEWHTHRPPV